MRLRRQRRGQAFDVRALELDNGSCPALEYLQKLENSHPELAQSMYSRIKYRADTSVIHNTKISKGLTGKPYNGLFRLIYKGERLCYCFLPGGLVVLLNGYNKNDVEEREWEKARTYYQALLSQIKRGDINNA